LAPSSLDGPICGLVKRIHQGEFRWKANDHGELDASGARGKSEATEDRLIRLCSPKLAP
jgi:hypothetical protein